MTIWFRCWRLSVMNICHAATPLAATEQRGVGLGRRRRNGTIPLNLGHLTQAQETAEAQGALLEWSLGTLGQVRWRNRELCRLINFVIFEAERTNFYGIWPSDTQLHLKWGSGTLGLDYFSLNRSSREDPQADQRLCFTPHRGKSIDFKQIREWIDYYADKQHNKHCKGFACTAHYGKPAKDSYLAGLDTLRLIDVKNQCVGLAINLRLTKFNKTELAYIPRTIHDATFLVEKIGERYLWCDALCLLQNDKGDLERGLKTIDLIYENAELTIVAAYGHDANASLPGVCEALSGYLTVDQRIKQCIYSSRAWTKSLAKFQEDLLSSRNLFFIDELVYLRCRSTTLSELFHPNLDRRITKMDYYDYVASLLPTRSLTNQEDALNAMRGIIQRMSRRMKCRFFEGLPTASFDYFIIFEKDRVIDRRPMFPSYSWTGWKGPLKFYRRSAEGTLNLVWDILANEDFPLDDDRYFGYRKRTPFRPPVSLAFLTSRTQPTGDLGDTIPVPVYPVLQFWTLSAFFNIQISDKLAGHASVIDRFGTACGTLRLDILEEFVAVRYELIAISAVHHSYWDPDAEPVEEGVNIADGYNVMLLMWNNGLAERRGIGFVRQKDFINKSLHPGAQWKEIILG
ncbi:HET-domain-containing protein [Xylaria curta]|nr:HET-domain-containing protein [Xylaria curta]